MGHGVDNPINKNLTKKAYVRVKTKGLRRDSPSYENTKIEERKLDKSKQQTSKKIDETYSYTYNK